MQQLGTAQAAPAESSSDQQPSSPVGRAAGHGSGQPALECDGFGPQLVVSSPTSPVSVKAVQGSLGNDSKLKFPHPVTQSGSAISLTSLSWLGQYSQCGNDEPMCLGVSVVKRIQASH